MTLIRFVISAVVTLFLLSGYFLYSAFVVPLTIAVEVDDPLPAMSTKSYRPPALSQAATAHFPDVAWIHAEQLETFESQDQDLILFTQKTEPAEIVDDVAITETDGQMLQMTPIAVLWKNPRDPEGKPFRLIAERGLVRFQNNFYDGVFDIESKSPGRIVWASLDGHVHIDGPEGLVIDGNQFSLSEKNSELRSDQPVTFRYGPTLEDQTEVAGSADMLELKLEESPDAVLGRDLPRVGGIKSLLLRKNVKLKSSYYQKGVQHHADIQCAGLLEYDLSRHLAAFENDVQLTHYIPDGGRYLRERLTCERLELKLKPNPAVETESLESEPFELLDNLVFQGLKAFGVTQRFGGPTSRVRLTSEQHELNATMDGLVYDADSRTATMTDREHVVVTRNEATFSCPKIILKHSTENSLVSLDGVGAGNIAIRGEHFPNEPAEANWANQLNVSLDPESGLHIAELIGEADFTLPKPTMKTSFAGMGIAADRLLVWIDLETAENLQEIENVLKSPLPVSRAQANGNVTLFSHDLVITEADGTKVDRIDVSIRSGKSRTTKKESKSKFFADEKSNGHDSQPVWVTARSFLVDLIHDAELGVVELEKVDGHGNVKFTHRPKPNESLNRIGGDNPIVLTGVRVVGEPDAAGKTHVTMLGQIDERGDVAQPAQLSFGRMRIGGANLSFHQSDNVVSIVGPGKFQLPISKDLDGNELEVPATMEIVWKEKMIFDGQSARFLKSVGCSFDNHRENLSKLNCEDLTVTLNRKLKLDEGANRNQNEPTEIAKIIANHLVNFEAYEFASENGQATELIGIRKGNLNRIEIDQTTKKFTGSGPGQFHLWSFGDSLKLSSTDQATANQPLNSESKASWRYSTLEFSSTIHGDLERKTAELENQRIRILSAPVERSLAIFKRNQLSPKPYESEQEAKFAENAVSMECRNLRVRQKEFNEKSYWELFAEDSTELEGRFFRAVADELSFDERLGKFMLRGIGKKARMFYQKTPREKYRSSEAQMIEFIPKDGSVTVDGASGLSG